MYSEKTRYEDAIPRSGGPGKHSNPRDLHRKRHEKIQQNEQIKERMHISKLEKLKGPNKLPTIKEVRKTISSPVKKIVKKRKKKNNK